MSVQIPASTK
ncbi:hypothetical protein AVEN_177024-1, partial [Araneus ventricosus]